MNKYTKNSMFNHFNVMFNYIGDVMVSVLASSVDQNVFKPDHRVKTNVFKPWSSGQNKCVQAPIIESKQMCSSPDHRVKTNVFHALIIGSKQMCSSPDHRVKTNVFKPRSSGQNKYYNIGVCCFSTKAALMRKSKDLLAQYQDNVSEWGDMSILAL